MQDDDKYLGLSDPPQFQTGKVSREEYARRIEADIKTVMSTISGRRLLYHLQAVFGIEGSPYRRDNNLTFLHLGQWEAGQYIRNLIKHADKNLYIKMERENIDNHYKYENTVLSQGEPSSKDRKKE